MGAVEGLVLQEEGEGDDHPLVVPPVLYHKGDRNIQHSPGRIPAPGYFVLHRAPKMGKIDGRKGGDAVTENDSVLINRFRSGDTAAFEELIVRYETKIYTTCLYFLKNREDAEDAAQEVIIKLYRKLDTFRQEASFTTWMNYVAANTCKDLLRKRKRDRVLSLDEEIETEDGQVQREIPDGKPGPGDCLEQKELREVLLRAIGELSEEHRAVMLMREYQTLSYEEISEIMGISLGTVKSRIHRARGELRQILRAMEQTPGL